MKRRKFLTLPLKSLGGSLLYTLAGDPLILHAQEGTVRIPLRFFTESESLVVMAACERIIPRDETGPGATDAGVIIYIDRQLAGPYGRDKHRYTKPPFAESFPEHGFQGKETPREIYRAGLAQLAGFAALPPEQQDHKLRAMEKTMFFRLLQAHTIEGFLCDPMHGGNAGLIGWQLVGYPGPLMSYRDEVDKNPGQSFRRKPLGLSDVLGRPVKGWEEEG